MKAPNVEGLREIIKLAGQKEQMPGIIVYNISL
jgi:thioester reductase-like protein